MVPLNEHIAAEHGLQVARSHHREVIKKMAKDPRRLTCPDIKFQQTPNWIKCRTELTGNDKLVYGEIYTRTLVSKYDYCWPSIATLSEALGIGTTTVTRSTNNLIKYELIERTHHYLKNGKQTSSTYYPLEHPWRKEYEEKEAARKRERELERFSGYDSPAERGDRSRKDTPQEQDSAYPENGQCLSQSGGRIDYTYEINYKTRAKPVDMTACNMSTIEDQDTPQPVISTDESRLLQELNSLTGQNLLKPLEPGEERKSIMDRLSHIIELSEGLENAKAAARDALQHEILWDQPKPIKVRQVLFFIERYIGIYPNGSDFDYEKYEKKSRP